MKEDTKRNGGASTLSKYVATLYFPYTFGQMTNGPKKRRRMQRISFVFSVYLATDGLGSVQFILHKHGPISPMDAATQSTCVR
jgi:hypothetical protein